MKTNLYLIRHGETDWNLEMRFQGHADIPLNETGIWQAKQLYKWFQGKRLDQIFCSDLKRARFTAELLARPLGLPVTPVSSLRERHVGQLEGLYRSEVLELFQTANLNELEMRYGLGIEPYSRLQERIFGQLSRWVEQFPGQHIAVVSHGAILKSFLDCIALGATHLREVRLMNTSVTHVVSDGVSWEIVLLNDVSHLEGSEEEVS